MAIGEIVGETVKSAMALEIRAAFAVTSGTPPVTVYPTIYKEQVLQGMVKPCFFIWSMDTTPEKQMNNQYNITYQMNVRYEPAQDDEAPYETCMSIALKLTEVLADVNMPIAVNGELASLPVHGKQISFNIADNVLQFYVTYTLKAYIPAAEAPTYMTELEQLNINK